MLTFPRDRTHMPALNKTHCTTIRSSPGPGFSIGSPVFANVDPNAMVKYDKTLSSFIPNLGADSREDMICTTVEVVEVVTVKLFNQKCDYYPHCCRGDYCRYLHDEPPTSTVFHNGSETCQTRTFSVTRRIVKSFDKAVASTTHAPSLPEPDAVDIRIFVSNIPDNMHATELRAIASKYGTVSVVQLLNSSVTSGRRAGFIHMESRRAATAAIAALQKTTFTDLIGYDHLLAKVQKELPLRSASPAEPKAKVVDGDGFTTVTSSSGNKPRRNTSTTSVGKPAAFAILDKMDEETIAMAIRPQTKNAAHKKITKQVTPAVPMKDEWPSIASLCAMPDLEPIEQETPTVADSMESTPTSTMALSLWDKPSRVNKLRETLGQKVETPPSHPSKTFCLNVVPSVVHRLGTFKPIVLASTLAATADDDEDAAGKKETNDDKQYNEDDDGYIEFEEGVDDWEIYAN